MTLDALLEQHPFRIELPTAEGEASVIEIVACAKEGCGGHPRLLVTNGPVGNSELAVPTLEKAVGAVVESAAAWLQDMAGGHWRPLEGAKALAYAGQWLEIWAAMQEADAPHARN